MQQDELIENLDELKCRRHNEKVILFSLENGIEIDDRLICLTCLQTIDTPSQSLSWSKAKQTLQDRHQQRQVKFQTERDRMVQLVMSFKSIVDQTKTKLLQTLDEIETTTTLWISNLEQLCEEGVGVSKQLILEELVKIVMQSQESQSNTPSLQMLNSLNQCNYNFQSKLLGSFKKFISFDSLPKLQEMFPEILSWKLRLSKQDLKSQQLNFALSTSLTALRQHINIVLESLNGNIDSDASFKQAVIEQVEDQMYNYSKLKPITYQLVDEIKLKDYCQAVAFNTEGTIMAASSKKKIKIWKIEQDQLKSSGIVLSGHTDDICCLVFSKKVNWLASSGWDCTIRCWKEMTTNNWMFVQEVKQHCDAVYCLLLNKIEDQVISCSRDKSIKVWKMDFEKNELTYDYSLNKHRDYVECISLNETETSLVSCSRDKSIIVWIKGQLNKWEFKYKIAKNIDDYGYRICFINDNMIAWQQYKQGITHIFELENGVFKERTELQITLNKGGHDGECLFPSVFNKKKGILIQKYNQYVYIIRQQNDGKFKIESQPIDCNDINSYGGLADNGEHLVIYNGKTKQLRLYKINE